MQTQVEIYFHEHNAILLLKLNVFIVNVLLNYQ